MPWWREVVPLGKHHLALCFVILIFSAGQGGNACPTSVSTLADMKSGIDCGGDGSCTLTAPELAAYTFDDPAVRITDMELSVLTLAVASPAVCSAAFHLYFGQHKRDDSRLISCSPLLQRVSTSSLTLSFFPTPLPFLCFLLDSRLRKQTPRWDLRGLSRSLSSVAPSPTQVAQVLNVSVVWGQ